MSFDWLLRWPPSVRVGLKTEFYNAEEKLTILRAWTQMTEKLYEITRQKCILK